MNKVRDNQYSLLLTGTEAEELQDILHQLVTLPRTLELKRVQGLISRASDFLQEIGKAKYLPEVSRIPITPSKSDIALAEKCLKKLESKSKKKRKKPKVKQLEMWV